MMRFSRLRVSLCVLLAIGLLPIVGRTADPAKTRPAAWAVKLDRPGLPNLHKINDNLYRGALPTDDGVQELKKLGVKTILNLREEASDRNILEKSKLDSVYIPMNALCISEKDVVQFLKVVADPNRQPVFFHCHAGADRTGAMCAVYRVVVEDWTKEQAIDEMVHGGYNFHVGFTNLPKFIRNLDVEKIKAEAGLKEPKEGKKK
jgi:protein tyrosine phosphatase (PTP) superfamily phosphohydrolase (DUF442 family)